MSSFAPIVICALFAVVYARPDGYTTKYDNIDLDQIIKSDRLLGNYVNCMLDRGRCNKEGQEIKKFLPDALKSNCSKCSEAQRNGARKIARHLIKNKREWWNELEAKYDPKGDYRRRHQEELRREGITL